MDFNFRAPSPMFKEISRLESPLFFDDFKVDVNISPSRFFTTTPPLWSPTKSLQTEESPTRSFLTNESPTFNCFVDNIQPNGLIPFKPQVVKLEGNSNNMTNNNNKLEDSQSSQTRLMLESKGGAFEKFNNPIDMMANNQMMGNNGSSFVKFENMNTNNNTTTPNNNNITINRMGGAFSKFDNNNNNNIEMNKPPQQPIQKMGMNTNIPFHPNPRNVPINNMKNLPNNIPNNNPNNNGINFAKFDNLPIYNQMIQNNNNINNNNNNNQMYGNMPHQDTTTFVKFESVTSNLNNNNNLNNMNNMNYNHLMNMNNMNNINNNNFPNHLHNNNINLPPNNNISTAKNIPPPKKTRGRKPQNQNDPSVEKPPTKKQKSKKEKEDLNKDKSIKPKFTTELTPTTLETIHKKRTQDLQSPTFTDDGHLKSRVKEKKEVPDKIQCLGSSKKKGTQCKNAALLEYIGPRPLYCAEHIEEDKNTLHGKCKCPYFKEKGDGKPCKQIILKELVMCYRHFDEVLATLTLEKAKKQRTLVQEMIKKLRQDSKTFLKTNIDLYQRKSKLLPKYIKLDGILAKFISEREKLESN